MEPFSPIGLMAVRGLDLDPNSAQTLSVPQVGSVGSINSWAPQSNTQLDYLSLEAPVEGLPLKLLLSGTRARVGDSSAYIANPAIETFYAGPYGRISGQFMPQISVDSSGTRVTPGFDAQYSAPVAGGTANFSVTHAGKGGLGYSAGYDRPIFGEGRLSVMGTAVPQDYGLRAMLTLPF